MIYCISDIHGRYDLYEKMLEKINFTKEDTLYILGDLVDRGDEGLRVVLDVAQRDNVIVLMGNHDYTALRVLGNLDKQLSADNIETLRQLIALWKINGGGETYREYKSLTKEDQRLALMTMDSFRSFAELKVGGREFVLCHAGIDNYVEGKPLSEYRVEDFISVRDDYSKPLFAKQDKFLVIGHTPTVAIEGAEAGKIYHISDRIIIDCGAVFDYGLGCLCLDTMEEFYVK